MEPGRQFHPPATSVTVQAIYDAESIAFLVRWHDMSADKTGKNDPTLPVPTGGREQAKRGCRTSAIRRPPAAGRGSLCGDARRRPPRHQSSPTRSRSRFRRRCRRAPASRTSSLATPRTRSISGSSISPARSPFSSPAGEARTSRRTTRGMSPASRATTRENGRSSSSGRFAQARAPRSCPESFCRSPSRSGTGSRASVATGEALTSWYSIYVEPEVVPSAVGPMVRTALIILVIELAVIGWVRWRHGQAPAGSSLRVSRSHPAATSA